MKKVLQTILSCLYLVSLTVFIALIIWVISCVGSSSSCFFIIILTIPLFISGLVSSLLGSIIYLLYYKVTNRIILWSIWLMNLIFFILSISLFIQKDFRFTDVDKIFFAIVFPLNCVVLVTGLVNTFVKPK